MIKTYSRSSQQEQDGRREFLKLFSNPPIPETEILGNLGLFVNRQTMSRFLFMQHLYMQILNVHGTIMEFGVRWGQNLALFSSFRGIYEPFNIGRNIVGFDTFSGFPSVHKKDGQAEVIAKHAYAVPENYEKYLEAILAYHETESPVSHIRKFELIKGDATVTIQSYLDAHPETVIALAYFDFDIYEPTKACLEAIKPHITKGTVIGFDELNMRAFPGETVAVREALGLDRIRIQRTPFSGMASYLVVE